METETKPTINLIGTDGNAFVIMGKVRIAAKKAGWNKEQIEKVMEEMQSGDYDNLLQTVMKYFEVN